MADGFVNIGLGDFVEAHVRELTDTRMGWAKDREFKLIESLKELSDYVDKAIAAKRCVVDIETTGLNTRTNLDGFPIDKIVGFCLSYDVSCGIYVPIGHKEGEELNLPEKEVLEEIARLCANCVTVYHNAKFDLQMLRNYGIIVDDHNVFEDTLVLARLYDAGQKMIGLKVLSDRLLNQPMLELSEITNVNRIDFVSPRVCLSYTCADAICTLGLLEFFLSQDIIKEQESVYRVEKRTTLVVMQMERNLVKIDVEYLKKLKVEVAEKMEEIKKEVFELAGFEFNLGSPLQLGEVLFDKLGYKYPERRKTASGQYITDIATLTKIADDYPIVNKIIKYRSLDKALGTYINNLLRNRDENGCIKLSFNQSGTDTGRFSSPGGEGIDRDGYCGMNVQSIPSNYEEGMPDIRKAFIARPGYRIVAADYSGEELRIATNLSCEPKWMDAFLHGDGDLHSATGRIIYGRQEITRAERQTAKCVAKGTRIATERGWIPVERVKIGDKIVTHIGSLGEVSNVWNLGNKPGVRICTKSGHEIICGRNHRFMTIEGEWIKAEDLKSGEKIRTISCSEISPKSIQRSHFNFWERGEKNSKSDDLPYVEFSSLWARLLGYVMGDGSVNVNNVRIVCSPDYADVKMDIERTAQALGLSVNSFLRHRTEKGLWDIHLGSRILVRLFQEWGFSGRRVKKDSKSTKIFRIPRIVYESPKSVSKEFLSSLFEADGTVQKTEVSVTTKDRQFAKDIVLLLAQFGIRAYIWAKPSKRYKRDYYKVSFGRAGAEIFHKEIGFISSKKQERLRAIVSKKRLSTAEPKWDTEIVDVKFIESVELMDLSVDEEHTYVAEGLVTHNTTNFLTMYGGGHKGLSVQAKISENEARKVLTQFFAGLPRLKRWIDVERVKAQKQKRVKTAFGRIRPLDIFYKDGDKNDPQVRQLRARGDRCAVNTLIQGAGADIMKLALVRVYNWIRSEGLQDEIRLLITMHDEIVFEIAEDRLPAYVPIINQKMKMVEILQDKLKWLVPLKVDVEYGDSWHVSNNFFEEHPELENVSEPVKMPPHRVQIPEEDKEQTESQESVQEPPQEESSEDIREAGSVEQKSPGENAPAESTKETVEDSTSAAENAGHLIYTLKDTRESTLRDVNEILRFLIKEEKLGKHKGLKKILTLRNKEGYSLLVSELKISVDAFLALARFRGL